MRMTTDDTNGSGGCNFDSDCDDGFNCHNGVCYIPDAPQSNASTPQQEEQQREPQQQEKQIGRGTGEVAGIAIAAVLVVVIVAGWIAMRASSSKIREIVMEEEEDQGKKADDGIINEAGTEAGGDVLP
jgi:hypothetical protein